MVRMLTLNSVKLTPMRNAQYFAARFLAIAHAFLVLAGKHFHSSSTIFIQLHRLMAVSLILFAHF